jgi:pterin-4a-carbinolamine dehydratase
MADKTAKTSTFKDYSCTKEGIKFMELIVTVGEKMMHHFTPQTKQT